MKQLSIILSQIKLYFRLQSSWRKAQHFAKINVIKTRDLHKALIIPCDPWSVIGSRGDQAMIIAIQQQIMKENPTAVIDILCENETTAAKVTKYGFQTICKWNSTWLKNDFQYLANYNAIYILGADVTDGVYSWSTSMMLLMYYDIASRLGVSVYYMGFSFSTRASRVLKFIFPQLQKKLLLSARDPVSLKRLKNFTSHRPVRLVADVAFCLVPRRTPRIASISDFCDTIRKEGKFLLGINLHSMFNSAETHNKSWYCDVTDLLTELLAENTSLYLLFLPHDDRNTNSDLSLLKKIYNQINPEIKKRILMLDKVFDADETKELVQHLDALIAGRMHLCIAAISSGIPVLGLVYQDKFEGLWQHFNLPLEKTLAKPELFSQDPIALKKQIYDFITQKQVYQTEIIKNLPTVKNLAFRNFEKDEIL